VRSLNKVISEDMDFIVGADLPWQRFAGKTVLITGANGFLPAYMVETLLHLNERQQLDIRVVGIVRNKEKALARFGDNVETGRLHLIVQDVCEPLRALDSAEFIIHAASQASPGYYGSDPVGTLKANVIGTYNLLELAREKSTESLLFFSSGEVYGQLEPNKIPTGERDYGCVDSMDVRSCYAESKRMGETMCVSWHHQHGVPAKVVRPFHTYGPGMSLTDDRVFASFVADVVARRDIVLKSSGTATRSFCYLAEATVAFFTVLLKGENAEAYNVGNDACEISMKDLANTVAGLFPEFGLRVVQGSVKRPRGYIESKISRTRPDISKIASLGWKPSMSIEEGFKRTIESYL